MTIFAAWAVDGAYVSGLGTPYYEGWESGANCWFQVADLETLLRNEYTQDVRFIPCVVVGRDGVPVKRQRRLVQSSGADGIGWLRKLGYDIRCLFCVADADLKLHRYRRLNRLQFNRAVERVRERGFGLSSSRAGLRAFKILVDSFPPEEYRARNEEFQSELTELLGDEYIIDQTSAQWTRVYRTPWCKRDGQVVEPWLFIDHMEPYELAPVSPEKLTDCSIDVPEYFDRLHESDPVGLRRMEAYARSVEPPRCGFGKCRKTLWNIALQCHLFGCSYADALRIVNGWVARSGHDRREWTPRVIAETVCRALSGRRYLPGARLDYKFVADSDQESATRDVHVLLREVSDGVRCLETKSEP